MDIKINAFEKNNINNVNETNQNENVSSNHVSKNISAREAVCFTKDEISKSKYGSVAYKGGASFSDVKNMASAMDIKNQKDYMTVMANTVSDKDFKNLLENGYEPGEMQPEEIVTITDRIKITMAKSGVVINGYNDDISEKKIEEVTGSAAYANEISDAMKKYDVPATESNIKNMQDSIDKASSVTNLNMDEVKYLVDNGLKPTISNIYTAVHSGNNAITGNSSGARGFFSDGNGYLGKKADVINPSIEKQITNVILESGNEITDENVADAKEMILSGMLFTPETFSLYESITSIDFPISIEDIAGKTAMSIKEGLGYGNADLSRTKTVLQEAEELVQKVNEITDDAVTIVKADGKQLNIQNLINAQNIIENTRNLKTENEKNSVNNVNSENSGNIEINRNIEINGNIADSKSSVRLLNEVRLQMTVSSTYVLLKNNIDVKFMDLNLLVDELKEAENRQFESIYGKDKTKTIESLFTEANNKLNEIKGIPAQTIGIIASRTSYNLNIVHSEGIKLQNAFEKANEKYEPLMTEVRRDLGDSISKAFSNVSDILSELDYEDNQENQRAVRILGYNSMEINEENIEKIKAVYHDVKSVIDMMKPGKVLELIRNGNNPLEMTMEELKEELSKKESEESRESYSRFLYGLEKSGNISKEEKESFIGIYRLLDKIQKNDGAAIGTLVGTSGEINFKNLLSAVRTRRDKGMDIKIDREFGSLEKLIEKADAIDTQIGKAFDVSGKAVDMVNEAKDASSSVYEMLNSYDIPANLNNVIATNGIFNNSTNIFEIVSKLSDKSTKKWQNVDKNVDNLSLNMENSIGKTGDADLDIDNQMDISFDADSILDNICEKIADSFESQDEVIKAYESMNENVSEILNKISESADEYIDVKSINASFKQLNVIKKFAENEFYQIPIKVGESYSNISLQIVHGTKEGNVNIFMETEKYGPVTGKFQSINETDFEGLIICDNEEGLNELKKNEETFLESLHFIDGKKNIKYIESGNSINNYLETVTKQHGMRSSKENEVSTKVLYKVAKAFIRTFM